MQSLEHIREYVCLIKLHVFVNKGLENRSEGHT